MPLLPRRSLDWRKIRRLGCEPRLRQTITRLWWHCEYWLRMPIRTFVLSLRTIAVFLTTRWKRYAWTTTAGFEKPRAPNSIAEFNCAVRLSDWEPGVHALRLAISEELTLQTENVFDAVGNHIGIVLQTSAAVRTCYFVFAVRQVHADDRACLGKHQCMLLVFAVQ